jgi:hypothetical protein
MDAESSDCGSSEEARGGGDGCCRRSADDAPDPAARPEAPPLSGQRLSGMLRLSECERAASGAAERAQPAQLFRASSPAIPQHPCGRHGGPSALSPTHLAASGYYRGADGRTHGPVAPDTIIGWARSGRLPVDAQARARGAPSRTCGAARRAARAAVGALPVCERLAARRAPGPAPAHAALPPAPPSQVLAGRG